jgi:uncharacterized protein DUF6335
MPRKKAKQYSQDAGKAERPVFVTDPEVKQDLTETSRRSHPKRKRSGNPRVSGGDLDASWDQIGSGEEMVGGTVPTPDQSIVEELGKAAGVTYEDNEPLDTVDKLAKRDRRRWELNAASAEDLSERNVEDE